MFDIGFMEMMLIGVVILVVVGPERLPKVARTVGLWLGKTRSFLSSVKADIDSELKAEELKRILAEQAKSSGLHEIIEESQSAAEDMKQASADIGKNLNKVSDEQAALWDARVAENQIKPPADSESDYLVKAVAAEAAQPADSDAAASTTSATPANPATMPDQPPAEKP